MRKYAGSIVLAMFLVSLYAPMAAALAMPAHACCFAHGEHHCASAAAPDGQPAVSARCPHHDRHALSSSVLAANARSADSYAPVTSSIPASYDAQVAAASPSNAHGRAPPVFLF